MKIPYGNLLLCKSIFKYKYNLKKKKSSGRKNRQDGSASKDCKFNNVSLIPAGIQDGKREPSPKSCPLNSTYIQWHMHTWTHMYIIHTWDNNKYSKFKKKKKCL